MLALLNPRCDYGKGLRTWRRIEPVLRGRYRDLAVEEIPVLRALPQRLALAVDSGERRFVAAGGDGTVNLVANALMGVGHDGVALGAVALGSSNDFHKPFRSCSRLEGVPAKLQWDRAAPRDVIMVSYRDADGQVARRICLINAGVGITAHANAIYNGHFPVISRVQRVSVEGAILASIVHALGTFRSIPCALSIDDASPVRLSLTNLAVLKSPHVAGALCYDTPVRPADGIMRVTLCVGMTKREILRTLLNLYRRRFIGSPKTSTHVGTRLRLRSAQPFALEMDGEVVHTIDAHFELVPGALRCCP